VCSRRGLDGLDPQGWIPEKRISLENAIDTYTSPAYAGFFDEVVGQITVERSAEK
tara:strand:+ start:290 stop:454 length:165 start_codon:yes stop_codon:yes gene_type:complete